VVVVSGVSLNQKGVNLFIPRVTLGNQFKVRDGTKAVAKSRVIKQLSDVLLNLLGRLPYYPSLAKRLQKNCVLACFSIADE